MYYIYVTVGYEFYDSIYGHVNFINRKVSSGRTNLQHPPVRIQCAWHVVVENGEVQNT